MGRYLSAPAHAVIISGDTNDYLHIHPTEKGKVNHDPMAGVIGMEGNESFPRRLRRPEKRALSVQRFQREVFPSYLDQVWAHSFQRGGRVITVPFVLNVVTASPGSDRE